VWRFGGDGVSQVSGGFVFANYPAFGPDGELYVSDSGVWGADDGCIRAGDEVLSRAAPHFTNGLAVSPDGAWLWVAESYLPRVGRIDLASGAYEEVVRLPGTVPDGLAFDDAGGVLISCYRPDRVLHLSAAGELTVVADDPQGTLLAAPTNVCFAGPELDRIVVANLGRWHLTAIDDTGLRGAPLHRP
jgi:gluconolactonase